MLALFRPHSDGSLQERMGQFAFGFEQIRSNPILGDYGGAFVHFKGQGHYMHNMFSVWQDFGLIPFIMFVILLGFVLYYSIKYVINRMAFQDNYLQMVIVFCLMAVLQVLLARSFGWSEIALAWGLMCGFLNRESYLISK